MQLTKARAALKAGAGMTLEFAMRKKWIAGLTTLVLLSGSLGGAEPAAGDTARDAYIEAWFLETAEADLEGALKAYGLCVERAGSGDRELAAKATWRMGRIARARGEEEVAVGLFERVVADYSGTDAAERAAKDLAGEEEAAIPKEDAAITEAREFLGDLLDDKEAYTSEKWRYVLDTLSVEEILSAHERRGGDLNDLVARDYDYKPDEKIAIGLARARYGLSKILRNLVGVSSEYIMTDELLVAGMEETWIAESLIAELMSRGGETSFATLERLLEGKAFASTNLPSWLIEALMRSDHPRAVEILATRVERALKENVLSSTDLPLERLYETSAGGDVIRNALKRLPPSARANVYGRVRAEANPGPLLDMWSSDPEPSLRMTAFGRMITSTNPVERAEGLRRFVDAGPPWDVEFLIGKINNIPSAALAGEILAMIEEVPAVLRDPLYRATLVRFPDSAGAILDFAVRVDHSEALNAAFSNLYRWDDELLVSRVTYLPAGVISEGKRDGNAMESVVSFPDSALLERMALIAAASDNVRLRINFVKLLSFAAQESVQVAASQAAEHFLRDPLPEVRRRIQGLLFLGLSTESRLVLIDDPSPELGRMFVGYESDEALLGQLARRLEGDRLQRLMSRVQELDLAAPLRVAYDRLADDHAGVSQQAFLYLSELDVDIVVETLGRADTVGRLQLMAVDKLTPLPLPDDLKLMVQGLAGSTEVAKYRQVAEALREQYSEVESAWRQLQIDQLLQTSQGNAARRLASLGAVEELREMSRGIESSAKKVGIHGLAILGKREMVREALGGSGNPGTYVGILAHAGMPDIVIELADQGRIKDDDASSALMSSPAPVQADFMVGPSERPSAPRYRARREVLVGAIEYLRATKDVDRLLLATKYYHQEMSVAGLLESHAYDVVLDSMAFWRNPARSYAVAEMHRITGVPAESAGWPKYQSEQQELIKAWREALADLPEGNPPEEDN